MTPCCVSCGREVVPGHGAHDALVGGVETFWCPDCAEEGHCPKCNQQEETTVATKRKVLMVKVDVPVDDRGRWSSLALTSTLAELAPDLRMDVLGEASPKDTAPAFLKLRQLSRETEDDAPQGDRVHSAHKAMSFFKEALPDRFIAMVREHAPGGAL